MMEHNLNKKLKLHMHLDPDPFNLPRSIKITYLTEPFHLSTTQQKKKKNHYLTSSYVRKIEVAELRKQPSFLKV